MYRNGTSRRRDLQKVKNDGVPLSVLEKLRILIHVGEVLQYAHQKEVTHRDVRPANIVRLPNGEQTDGILVSRV